MTKTDRHKFNIIDSTPMNQPPIKHEGQCVVMNHKDSTYDYFDSEKDAKRWARALSRRKP